jgi:hypothetical protein
MKFSSDVFEYDAKDKMLKRAFNYKFPDSVFVTSSRTKNTVEFLPVSYGDDLYDEDGWDGEQMVYRAVSPDPKIREVSLVLYHSF